MNYMDKASLVRGFAYLLLIVQPFLFALALLLVYIAPMLSNFIIASMPCLICLAFILYKVDIKRGWSYWSRGITILTTVYGIFHKYFGLDEMPLFVKIFMLGVFGVIVFAPYNLIQRAVMYPFRKND